MAENLKQDLESRTAKGALCYSEKDKAIRCVACGHRCYIPEGFDGICKVRGNRRGELRVPWGYVGGLQVDPIEKKPFFHVMPGCDALSFGMLGCDFHCAYCQNWLSSQTLRDPNSIARPSRMEADELVSLALKSRAKLVTSTYNEPLITSEWAMEIFSKAQERGLRTSYVSNGNGTKEVLEYIRPYVDYYKIDLKSFRDKTYRSFGGVLKNVLDTIERVFQMGFWLEIVTLVVPGLNDDEGELREMVQFLRTVSPNIPWHVTAFHSDYKMQQTPRTSRELLTRVAETARAEGMRFVYVGNLPGQVGGWENTFCPGCHTELVARRGFKVLRNEIVDGSCPKCHEVIPGDFSGSGTVSRFPVALANSR